MLELDKIYCMDCLEGMRQMEAESVDLTVTSPPYDNLRTYNGYCFDFENIARELYRVTKQGGVVVWVVGDATIDGSETGTSFRQALYFKDIGFRLHDTMIWEKADYVPLNHNRYEQCFEYMFVLSKGRPKTFNPIKERCLTFGTSRSREKSNKETGSSVRNRQEQTDVNEYKIVKNIFVHHLAHTNFDHPAVFPELLVRDHINSWSNEGDVVLDPFMGSGTTAKVARALNRHYIGFEISAEYCDIIRQRLEQTKTLFDL